MRKNSIPVKTVCEATALWDFVNSSGSGHQHKIGRAAAFYVWSAKRKQLRAGYTGTPPSSPWPRCLLHCITLFLHGPPASTSSEIVSVSILPFWSVFMFLGKGLSPCSLLPQAYFTAATLCAGCTATCQENLKDPLGNWMGRRSFSPSWIFASPNKVTVLRLWICTLANVQGMLRSFFILLKIIYIDVF